MPGVGLVGMLAEIAEEEGANKGAMGAMAGPPAAFDFPEDNHSDIDVNRWIEPVEKPSKGRAILESIFGFARKDPVGAYYGSINEQGETSREQRLMDFYRERAGSGDTDISQREKMEEFYIAKSLGFNASRPEAERMSRYTETGMGDDGRRKTRDVFQLGDKTQAGDWSQADQWSAAQRLTGKQSVQDRLLIDKHQESDDQYWPNLWGEALRKGSIEDILNGNSGSNSIAGREIKKALDSISAQPGDPKPGTMAYTEHLENMKRLHDIVMGGIATPDSSQETDQSIDDLRAKARAEAGMTPIGPNASVEPESLSIEDTSRKYEEMGQGLIPGVIGGVWDKLGQPYKYGVETGHALRRGARQFTKNKTFDSDWWDRNNSGFNPDSDGPSQKSIDEYGPMNERAVPSFLRGVGNNAADYLLGGGQGEKMFGSGTYADPGQNGTSPAAVNFDSIDSALMKGGINPMKLMMMTPQQKQEAYEELNLNGEN
jgi:hypothetical protein